MRSAYIFTAALLILLWAIALQLPVIHNMATHLLKQELPIIHSFRALLSRHKVVSVPTSTTLLASNQRSSPTTTPLDHKRFSSSSSTTMADTKPFFAAVEGRRTIYPLANESPISDERIKEIVAMAVKHAPSAFNSQTGRVVVVLKKEHVRLWESIMEVYKAMLPEERYNSAKERFDMFKAAYGTVSLMNFDSILVQRSRLTAFCYRYSSTKTLPTSVSFKRSSSNSKTNSHNVSALHTQHLPFDISPSNTSSSVSQGLSRAMA